MANLNHFWDENDHIGVSIVYSLPSVGNFWNTLSLIYVIFILDSRPIISNYVHFRSVQSLIIGFNRNVIQRHFQNCSIWNIRINEFRATIFTFQRSKQHLDFSWFRPIYHCVSNASVFIFNNLEFKFLIKKLI